MTTPADGPELLAGAELLDARDPDSGEVIATLPRSQVHRQGLWHDVFHCLVVRPTAKSVVLQRRSPTKAAFPGRLDVSVSGHLASGETPLDGVREAREELGVDVDATALAPVDICRQIAGPSEGGEGTDRERAHRFLLVDDRPIDRYRPSAQEVAGLVEIEIERLLALLDDPDLEVTAMESAGGAAAIEVTLRQGDLVHTTPASWLPLLDAARSAC